MATTEAQALLEKARATPKPYTVGSGYTVDTSAYAGSTDPNAVALKSYDNQLNAYKAALQAAYDSQAAANISAQNKVKSQFDSARSNVYTNARLSAIGNNERLAALGLAGNIYDHARSGTSETNRIAQDIAMRKSLSSLDQGRADAYSEYQLALLQAQKEADMNYANKVAEVEAAKIPYQMALAQALATVSGGGGGGGYSYSRSSSGSSSGGSGSGNNYWPSMNDVNAVIKAAAAADKKAGGNSASVNNSAAQALVSTQKALAQAAAKAGNTQKAQEYTHWRPAR